MRERSGVSRDIVYSTPVQSNQVSLMSESPGILRLLVGKKTAEVIHIKVGTKERELILANINHLGWSRSEGALTYIYAYSRHGDRHSRLARWLYLQLVDSDIGHTIVRQSELNDYRVESFVVAKTSKSNIRSMIERAKLRISGGYRRHNQSVLTEKDIINILHRLLKGDTRKDIALYYQVDPTSISDIASGASWKSLTGANENETT